MYFGSRECEASRETQQYWCSANGCYPTENFKLQEAPSNYQQGYVLLVPEAPRNHNQNPYYHPIRHVPEAHPIMRPALFVKEDSVKCDVDKEAEKFIKYEHKKFERKLQPIKSGEEFFG